MLILKTFPIGTFTLSFTRPIPLILTKISFDTRTNLQELVTKIRVVFNSVPSEMKLHGGSRRRWERGHFNGSTRESVNTSWLCDRALSFCCWRHRQILGLGEPLGADMLGSIQPHVVDLNPLQRFLKQNKHL